MKIVFITDLHLDVSFEFPLGIDTQKNLQRILKACRKVAPDLLVIGGDICYRAPEKEIYAWLMNELEEFDTPFEIIAGNHDNSNWLATSMQKESWLQKEEFFFAKKIEQHLHIFLDSAKGKLTPQQFKWLSRQLYQHKGMAMIFMHHPPVAMGVPYMDNKHAFEGGESLMKLFHDHKYPIHIFTGHYHVEKTVLIDNVSICITPSCFFQLDQNQEEFKVDHHRIAYRVIDIEKGKLATAVHYLAGSRT